MATDTEKRNMELMQTLDDGWNAQDLNVFRARHKPDVIVRWPGKIAPTVGIEDHTQHRRALARRADRGDRLGSADKRSRSGGCGQIGGYR